MEIFFNNPYLEQLYLGETHKGKPKYPNPVIEKFIKRVDFLKNIENAEVLLTFKSLKFEKLVGEKSHLYSIRINNQYRLEFELDNSILKMASIVTIENLSNHYQ